MSRPPPTPMEGKSPHARGTNWKREPNGRKQAKSPSKNSPQAADSKRARCLYKRNSKECTKEATTQTFLKKGRENYNRAS